MPRICQQYLFPLLCATAALEGSNNITQRDVVVIGGGSAGTYTAFRLQQEGLSVALLEKSNRLGGHVNTFQRRYQLLLVARGRNRTPPLGGGISTYANLNGDAKATTVVPSSMPWANSTAVSAALTNYVNLYNTQFPFLDDGFNLPDPVPKDILLSWTDFMAKYDLDAASFSAYSVNQGVVNEMTLPAIYAMKYFSSLTAGGFLGVGPPLITTSGFNNQGIYDKALQKLGEGQGAFLNAFITKVTRGADGVSVVMQTPSANGKTTTTTVQAKKLVIAIPPTLANFQAIGLDLSPEEERLFGQTSSRWYFDALLQNSGLPDDIALTNTDFSLPDGIPTADRMLLEVGQAGFVGVPGLHSLYYSSSNEISDADAQADILATLAKYRAANGLDTTVEPVFVGFNNHTPYELTVPADAIRNGYYKERNALQGCNNTWYTGAAWQAHDSTLIWNFTETAVVQKVVGVLRQGGNAAWNVAASVHGKYQDRGKADGLVLWVYIVGMKDSMSYEMNTAPTGASFAPQNWWQRQS
ncbi:hypothetical protein K438DRAFT_1943199 [Mycena galopus ATCC 62051]|nr:hypothetical protein K438DRAFT_1943199 [Mycena galopus ATCC 62051]